MNAVVRPDFFHHVLVNCRFDGIGPGVTVCRSINFSFRLRSIVG